MASLNHLITPMGRVYVVAVVLDFWTVFNAILKAHSKEFGINSGGMQSKEHFMQLRQLLALQNRPRPLNDPYELETQCFCPLSLIAIIGSGTRMTGQLPPCAFEEDQTLGGNWIKDKIDTIPIRAPGFIPDDVPAEASGV
ncbi:hypothetical protein FCIRC_8177 [Fusarium circinatum]|uniref:Uncharacterized protein n=1 Tax=Fusarium circinatum TaxID=48490 RepID=A0A8H5TIJ9_FUSCI|nr:hypothetical protein FCIRC_8177 [Fusarium circinatum]